MTATITLRISEELKSQLEKMVDGSVNRGSIAAMSKLNILMA